MISHTDRIRDIRTICDVDSSASRLFAVPPDALCADLVFALGLGRLLDQIRSREASALAAESWLRIRPRFESHHS